MIAPCPPNPASRARRLAVVLLCMALLTSGCDGSGIIHSTRGYVLVHSDGEALVPLADDDPQYTLFEQQVLRDAYLKTMLDLFEHTTLAFSATNIDSPLGQTVLNHPIVVLDSAAPGVLRDIVVHTENGEVPIERALGLGTNGSVDLPRGREACAFYSALWLLELMGVSTPEDAGKVALELAAPADQAFSVGLAAASDAARAQAAAAARTFSSSYVTPEDAARRRAIAANAYAYVWADGHATALRLPRADAMRTPGAMATFLYRLLERTDVYYPQRYMLWFMQFSGPEIPMAKVLRVCQQLATGNRLDGESFLTAYAETYPAERALVLSLADEVFSSLEATDGRAP